MSAGATMSECFLSSLPDEAPDEACGLGAGDRGATRPDSWRASTAPALRERQGRAELVGDRSKPLD